jgi:hypothetical protein
VVSIPADAWPGEAAEASRVRWDEVVGVEYVQHLQQHLRTLRQAYDHPNRKLHLDQYVICALLGFFTPVLRSLRQIEDFSQLPQAQRELGLEQVCRNSFSQASALFDPRLLVPMLRQIRTELPDLRRRDPELQELYARLVAGDGSYFKMVAALGWALRCGRPEQGLTGRVRLDLQLEVCTGLPLNLQSSGNGDGSEILRQSQMLQAGKLYLFDRYYMSLEFLAQILEAGSDFVIRARAKPGQGPKAQVIQERELGEEDRAHGVIADRVVRLPGGRWTGAPPQCLLREVLIQRPGESEPVRLITNLLEHPAWMIGQLYRKRWGIEIFFRWLKCWAGYRHLISRTPNGVLLQFYLAVLGTLLLCRASRQPPSKYAYGLLCAVAGGWGSAQDLLPILQRRQRERLLAKARLARKQAAQKN